MKTTSINHGIIASYLPAPEFKKLEKQQILTIYQNILRRYDLPLKKSRKVNVISVKHCFFNIMAYNYHSLTEIGRIFSVDHSSVIHGRDKIKGYLANKDEKTLFWYKEVMHELVKYGYQNKFNA